MTTQAITDYLTKQIFIEKNVVTYRSLSRQFSIHVNAAKNELATYHHNAPYQSQTCIATFLLSGTLKAKPQDAYDEDIDMDCIPDASQEDHDSEEVPQTTIAIVNERDLEDTKTSYEEICSIYVYSLAPAALHDAGLLCTPTEQVRDTDKTKGQAYAATVGRVVCRGIKAGASKKKAQPAGPVAGPSKLKMPIADPKAAPKVEVKEASNEPTDKGKGKSKAIGKLQFFAKTKETKIVKKEDSVVDLKKKMFFSKPAVKAPSPPAPEERPVPSTSATDAENPAPAQETKAALARGIKRKSSIGLERRERTPENPAVKATSSKAENGAKVKRRVVLSDDESDTAPAKPAARKSRPIIKAESTDNSEAEREAMALMDIDDDEVEKVSRVPSTNASSNERDDNYDEDEDSAASPAAEDEDVHMADNAPAKPKAKPRKPKAVIPVGRNGLKKKKVTKTRRTMGEDGYIRKVDYSDWESVDGDEPEAPAPVKAKTKVKAAPVKKESEKESLPPPAAPAKEKEKVKEAPAPKKAAPTAPATTKASKPAAKAASAAKGKGQQQKLNFFGPKKT